MKKKVFAAIGAMAVAGVIGLTFSQSGIVNADPKLTHEDVRNQVTEQYPGNITELELDKKGKEAVYEVEIELDGKEYDIKMDGDTGEVLKLEETALSKDTTPSQTTEKLEIKEKQNNETKKETKKTETKQKSDSTKQTVISLEEAKQIALDNFSGKITEIELDEDDDRLIYEVQLEEGENEADIEIDAYTGEVIMLEIEMEDDWD